jgi:hypothetical protein
METCCLFLAGKVEETPKKCKGIIKTFHAVLNYAHFAHFGDDPKVCVIIVYLLGTDGGTNDCISFYMQKPKI